MRAGSAQGVARAMPWDRNQVFKGNIYGVSGVAPHASTTRWSYTVAVGKKAFCQSLLAKLIRDVVATAAGIASAVVNYTPNGGSAQSVVFAVVLNNTLGAADSMAISPQMVMGSGDLLVGVTADASTAGSMFLNVGWTGYEFDT